MKCSFRQIRMFVGRAGPFAQPSGSALFRSARRGWLSGHLTDACRPVLHASSSRRRACSLTAASFCPARGTADLDRKGRRGPGSGRPARRSADALIAPGASGEFAGRGAGGGAGAGPVLGSAVRRSRGLLVMPGHAHPQSGSHFQMEGVQAEDRHNPLPHIALSTTAPKSVYEKTASLVTDPAHELE